MQSRDKLRNTTHQGIISYLMHCLLHMNLHRLLTVFSLSSLQPVSGTASRISTPHCQVDFPDHGNNYTVSDTTICLA
jgi:hypothetical protein